MGHLQSRAPGTSFKQPTSEGRYFPREGVPDTAPEDRAAVNRAEFERRCADSPVQRTTFDGFKRNVCNALQNALNRRAEQSDTGTESAS
jgi:epoxyqueuosine reductase QueG